MTHQRTVVITGGTSGLGYHTAGVIAADRGWLVLITGRDADKLGRAAGAREGIVGMPLDLASLAGVRRFAADLVGADLPPLGALVCNAGIQRVSDPTSLTEDGFEPTFGVNHLAHFLLVRELLPHLAPSARIVFVASDTHDPAKRTGMPDPIYTDARALAWPTPAGAQRASLVGRRRYTTSKLCNVLTTYELARRLAGDPARRSITVNAFDPGLMPGTGLARDYRRLQRLGWRYLLPALTVVPGLNVHTPRRSARALARLVLDPTLATTTGHYFSGTRQVRSSADSYDRAKAADLWHTSTELVTTTEPEPGGSTSSPL